MHRANLPLLIVPSHAARSALGRDLKKVALLVVKAILQNCEAVEVAHQQVRYRKHDLAFSSRIGSQGDLILELDLGDPRLSHRIVLEADLRRAERNQRCASERRWR
jgi:hypothetical protein